MRDNGWKPTKISSRFSKKLADIDKNFVTGQRTYDDSVRDGLKPSIVKESLSAIYGSTLEDAGIEDFLRNKIVSDIEHIIRLEGAPHGIDKQDFAITYADERKAVISFYTSGCKRIAIPALQHANFIVRPLSPEFADPDTFKHAFQFVVERRQAYEKRRNNDTRVPCETQRSSGLRKARRTSDD